MYLVLLGFILILACFAEGKIDYCSINKNHILCGAEKGLEVGGRISHFSPKYADERKRFLDHINNLRTTVARGNFLINNIRYPMASNMFEMEWCDICEKAALNLLKQCDNFFNRNCCNCMNTGEMDLFSTGFKTEYYTKEGNSEHDITTAFNQTFYPDNLKKIPLSCVSNVSRSCFDGSSGFLFSLLNARQVKIGCAYVECFKTTEKSKKIGVFACVTNLNFDLDMKGKDHYLTLEPASQCPKQYSSPSYTNRFLCKCHITRGCVVKPAELSSQCTNRTRVALDAIPPIPYAFSSEPIEVGDLMIEVGPVEISNVTKENATATTKKNVTDSGGAKD